MRDLVLEVGLAGETLEVGGVHPALPKTLVREPMELLQQQGPDHEARLRRGTLLGRETIGHLLVDPVPIDLFGQPDQLVLHVDDLIERGTEEIVVP